MAKSLRTSKKSYLALFLSMVIVLGGVFAVILSSRLSEPEDVSPEKGEASVINNNKKRFVYAVQSVLDSDGKPGWSRTCEIDTSGKSLDNLFKACSRWYFDNFLVTGHLPQRIETEGKKTVSEFAGYDVAVFTNQVGESKKMRQILLDREIQDYFWTRICNMDNSGFSKSGVKDWETSCGKWSSGFLTDVGLINIDNDTSSIIDIATHNFKFEGSRDASFIVLSTDNSKYSIIDQITAKYFESTEFNTIDFELYGGEALYNLSFPGLYSAHGSFSYIQESPAGGKQKVVERIVSEGGARSYGRICDIDQDGGGPVEGCEWLDTGVIDITDKSGETLNSFSGYGSYVFTTISKVNLDF